MVVRYNAFQKRSAFNLTVTLPALTARLKANASWDDEYPAWQEYADECERLLVFAQNHGVLDRFWPRLRSKKEQRDEALNELRVAHFLNSIGYAVVEVKSPGWESELTEAERNAGRKELPKHIHLEGRVAAPTEIIRRTLVKAQPKFTGLEPSILFITLGSSKLVLCRRSQTPPCDSPSFSSQFSVQRNPSARD